MSIERTLSHYSDMNEREVRRFLRMSTEQLLNDPAYQEWTHSIDGATLKDTLPEARETLEGSLESITATMMADWGMQSNSMSSYTLGNWLVGFAESPTQMHALVKMHDHLPREMLRENLPVILDLYGQMRHGSRAWQHAMAVFVLPIICGM